MRTLRTSTVVLAPLLVDIIEFCLCWLVWVRYCCSFVRFWLWQLWQRITVRNSKKKLLLLIIAKFRHLCVAVTRNYLPPCCYSWSLVTFTVTTDFQYSSSSTRSRHTSTWQGDHPIQKGQRKTNDNNNGKEQLPFLFPPTTWTGGKTCLLYTSPSPRD